VCGELAGCDWPREHLPHRDHSRRLALLLDQHLERAPHHPRLALGERERNDARWAEGPAQRAAAACLASWNEVRISLGSC
jgi:hypothetical protein